MDWFLGLQAVNIARSKLERFEAPTARNVTAWANGPGEMQEKSPALKARNNIGRRLLIPDPAPSALKGFEVTP